MLQGDRYKMMKRFRHLFFFAIALTSIWFVAYGCASSDFRSAGAPRAEVPSPLAGREPIVLVCPIDSLTSDEDISYLSLAMAPLMRRDLFCVQRLSVIPTADVRTSGKTFFLTEDGLKRLALMHGADIVVAGMLRGDKAGVRIEFEAYDAKSNYFIFRTEIEGKKSKLLKLQRELVYRLIEAFGIVLTKEEHERLASSSPGRMSAALEYGKGLRLEQKEKYTDALIAYGNAIDADRDMAVPYVDEGRIYRTYNAPLRAMQSYEDAVGKDAFFAEAWYQLNLYAAEYKENYDFARKCCEKALEIAPRFGKARLSLGARLYALGDLPQAIEETKKSVELLPADPLPRYNLGIYYRDAGKADEARGWFEEALKIDPKFQLALSELETL